MKKIFTKEHSREYSLFRTSTLYRVMYEWLPSMLGNGPFDSFSVYSGGDLTSVYYEKSCIKNIFFLVAEKCRDIESMKKHVKKFLELFDRLKPYFMKKKYPKDTSHLKELLDDYNKIWGYISIMYAIPMVPDADKELKDMAFKARQETQEYNESMEPVIKETLEKFYPELKGNTRFVLPEEIFDNKLEGIQEKIIERKKGFVFYERKLYTGNPKKILEELGLEIEESTTDTKEIKGQIAFKGKTTGKVRIVSKSEDIQKVEEGDILVAAMTMPKYLPAMKKASAFVTDEGGITCHAAIVSREMKKPCIIGTKIATKLLNDGDTVEVDADKGVVKIIK